MIKKTQQSWRSCRDSGISSSSCNVPEHVPARVSRGVQQQRKQTIGNLGRGHEKWPRQTRHGRRPKAALVRTDGGQRSYHVHGCSEVSVSVVGRQVAISGAAGEEHEEVFLV